MLRLRAIGHWGVLFLLLCCAGGCFQGNNHPPQEEADAHFQKGRELADGQDFNGAAREFELALEDNPRSASAHFELGWLYDTKLNDYAAAIYHYERHLFYNPDSKRAILVKERIRGCKEQLANAEFPLPVNKDLQKEVDRLTAENQQLKKQLEEAKNQPSPVAIGVPGYVTPVRYAAVSDLSRPGSRPRAHVVRPHETFSSIAAQYGIKTSVILAANPRINPRRLRVGQSLNLP